MFLRITDSWLFSGVIILPIIIWFYMALRLEKALGKTTPLGWTIMMFTLSAGNNCILFSYLYLASLFSLLTYRLAIICNNLSSSLRVLWNFLKQRSRFRIALRTSLLIHSLSLGLTVTILFGTNSAHVVSINSFV
jgi:hypothetical protein